MNLTRWLAHFCRPQDTGIDLPMNKFRHMDVASRNQRLRETLEGMGLFVMPIYCESDPSRIDYMQVSVTLPTFVQRGTDNPARAIVPTPMPRSDDTIGDVGDVGAAKGLWNDNVANLPTKF